MVFADALAPNMHQDTNHHADKAVTGVTVTIIYTRCISRVAAIKQATTEAVKRLGIKWFLH